MLEVNDLENELSFAPKSDYQKADDQAEVSVIKKTRARLEQLERDPDNNSPSPEQDEKTIEISQSQYVAKVKEMQKRLIASWEQNHKVEALRIAIKCVKLLADTDTAPQLYPCVFVLVSEVLDAFGKLVFDRIHTRASEDENGQPHSGPLGEHFMSSDINIQATETCRNWFYKTACIRELLPRIGVGEPMVALYARLYLALTSSELLGTTSPTEQTIVVNSSLFDYFYVFNWFRQNKLERWLFSHKMEYEDYLALHSPAVEWLVKYVVRHLNAATPEELTAKTYNLLGALIENVVFGAKQHYDFFSKLIPSTSFLALMGMFKRESSVDVAKKVLRAFVGGRLKKSSDRSGTLRLHVLGPKAAVAHTLLVVCCRVHDALDSLSTASERAEANRDISAFITRLGYINETTGSDRAQDEEQEALLMLYTDCRRAFYKLEPIKMLLSSMVLRLAMHVHKRIGASVGSKKRTHARRNFIQSCLAFAHITIPSIEAPLEKLQLMVAAANVALVTNCIPQMDALVKAAIVLLADLDPNTIRVFEGDSILHTSNSFGAVGLFGAVGVNRMSNGNGQILQIIAQLMSVLVYAPSLNDEDAFYFVSALRKAVLERMKWTPISRLEIGVVRVRVLLMLVQLYALWGQRSLPGRLDGVDSNDVLYGGDGPFTHEVQTRFSSTVEEVAREIEALGELNDGNDRAENTQRVVAAQIELMLDFVNLVVPVLEYDGSFPIEEAASRQGRRHKKLRSGVALVRKCMAYSHEKAQSLKQAKPLETSTSQVQMTTWICRYFDSMRVYVAAFMQGMSKRSAGLRLDASSQQAVQGLAEALNNLALA
ncbi:hypothetical protein AM588_10009288 [Phytophthora nicotianae]|uniref:Uncharacterized protein n=1 Tax=Phytophthora nicotianae TaxID=4792 RepID=A0A0W8DJV6_PHYNI|nr:hypothetical protein AM588_10009288 [Phytophthora nicotianae]